MRQAFFIAIVSAACILPLFGCSAPPQIATPPRRSGPLLEAGCLPVPTGTPKVGPCLVVSATRESANPCPCANDDLESDGRLRSGLVSGSIDPMTHFM